MKEMLRWARCALTAMLLLGAGAALAQGTVKIGVVAEFSGPFADYGAQIVAVALDPLAPGLDLAPFFKLMADTTVAGPAVPQRKKDRTHYLYIAVIVAMVLGIIVGFVFPGEIALILGGVMAYEGRVPLAAVLAVPAAWGEAMDVPLLTP